MELLLTPEARRIPVRALLLSLAALAVPVTVAFFFPDALGEYSALLWLVALVPAFLLAYYRGWRGSATALAVGMALLSATHAVTVGFGTGVLDLLLWVVALYIGISLGVGWLAEGLLRERKEVESLALMDPVTGLPNRRHAYLYLKGAFAEARAGRGLAVVVFDLDHFKGFNDRYGHAKGDEALRVFGQLLARTTRRTNLAARLGGEEFVCVLLDTDERGALVFAERVRGVLAATTLPQGWRLTVSAGISVFEPNMRSPDELLEAADCAMYRAKGDGRNCVRVFGRSPESLPVVAEVEEAVGSGAVGLPGAAVVAAGGNGRIPTGENGTPRRRASDLMEGVGEGRGVEPGPEPSPVGPGRRVLLVEDDDTVRQALARFLVKEGFRVTEAPNAFQAIQALSADFDIVLTDVRMPGASGIDLVAALKSRRPSTPIIVFTGLNEAKVAAEALNAGADRYLFKPVDLVVLRRHIWDLLARYDRLVGGPQRPQLVP